MLPETLTSLESLQVPLLDLVDDLELDIVHPVLGLVEMFPQLTDLSHKLSPVPIVSLFHRGPCSTNILPLTLLTGDQVDDVLASAAQRPPDLVDPATLVTGEGGGLLKQNCNK